MTFSTIFCLCLLFGMYQLGAYNEKHPGELGRLAGFAWSWLRQSWK